MHRDATQSPAQGAAQRATTRHTARAALLRLLAAMLCGTLLLVVAYQVPATHVVDIGGDDAAYTQGFYDPERADARGDRPYLAGSDGRARWTRAVSYLLFPQVGLPAQVTLRLRGWRESGPPPAVTVLLNGTRELGRVRTSGAWEQHTFVIDGGLWKPSDVVIELRAATAPLSADDPRPVGVLLDRATYRAGPPPITPYPPQLAYGALAAGMLWLLFADKETRRSGDKEQVRTKRVLLLRFSTAPLFRFSIAWLLVLGSWLCLYRIQPLYPYPLRGLLPTIDGVLAVLLAWRYGPLVVQYALYLGTDMPLAPLYALAAWAVGMLGERRGARRAWLPPLATLKQDAEVLTRHSVSDAAGQDAAYVQKHCSASRLQSWRSSDKR